jgi:fluoride ion exporter CrcB/FEX
MKVLFFVVLTFASFCANAQPLLSAHEPMSPFCKVMAPLMGLFIVGAIGYAVVKVIGRKDKTS